MFGPAWSSGGRSLPLMVGPHSMSARTTARQASSHRRRFVVSTVVEAWFDKASLAATGSAFATIHVDSDSPALAHRDSSGDPVEFNLSITEHPQQPVWHGPDVAAQIAEGAHEGHLLSGQHAGGDLTELLREANALKGIEHGDPFSIDGAQHRSSFEGHLWQRPTQVVVRLARDSKRRANLIPHLEPQRHRRHPFRPS